MLKNVFIKTIYEKRWTIIGWFIAIIAFTAMVVLLFPILKDSFGQALKDVPESLKSLVGNANTYQVLNSYVDVQVIAQMVFMPVILGIILFTGLIAGKEEQGTIQSLLAQPVKRSAIYIQMLLAGAVIIAVSTFSIWLTTIICAQILNEPIDVLRLSQACFSIWLITMLISVFGYCVGAITAKRGFAGMIAGIIAFLSYTITALAPGVKALKYPNYFSPFKYFNTPSVMMNGLDWNNVAVMSITCLLLATLGFIFFVKRDIYQR